MLLDLMLPGTDGIELMKQVPELDELPVIFISAYARDENHRQSARERRGRLHRQTVLPHRTPGPRPRRAQGPRRARDVRPR